MPTPMKRLLKLDSGDELDEFLIADFKGEGKSQTAKTYATTGDEVVKLFVMDKSDPSYKFRFEKFKNEAGILKKLEHSPYVLDTKTDYRPTAVHNSEQKEAPYYAMEKMEGNVQDLVLKEDVSLPDKLAIINQTILAMIDFHNEEVCHRDLYTPNVLFRRENGGLTCKVADFGSAKELNKPQLFPYNFPTGNRRFSSPEAVCGLLGGDTAPMNILSASDVFSLGLLMYEVLTEQNQDNVTTTLASISVQAQGNGMYDPKTDDATRENFLNQWAIPVLKMAKINDIGASDIISTTQIASELTVIMKDLLNYDYNHRPTDLSRLSAQILDIKTRVEANP